MRSIVNNLGRALVKKRALTLSSKDINIIDNTTVFDNYKGNLEQKVFKNIQSENGLKPRTGATEGDGAALTFTFQKKAIKITQSNSFHIPFDFNFLATCSFILRKDLCLWLELNVLCSALETQQQHISSRIYPLKKVIFLMQTMHHC